MDRIDDSKVEHRSDVELSVLDLFADTRHLLNLLNVLSREMLLEAGFERNTVQFSLDALTQAAVQFENLVHRPSFKQHQERHDRVGMLTKRILDYYSVLAKVRSYFFEALWHGESAKQQVLEPDKIRALLRRSGDKLVKASLVLRNAVEDASKTDTSKGDVPTQTVFICHNEKDKSFVRKLAADIQELNLEVWFDEYVMLPGDSLYEKIGQGIRDSSWFLIILSPDSVRSKWCQRELREALEEEFKRGKVYVVPLLYRDCKLPPFLREKFWLDCSRGKYKKAFSILRKRFGC